MRPHHRADIERLEAIEQPAPDDRDDAGRREQLRETHQRVGLELTPLDGHGAAWRGSLSITRAITSR